MIFGYYVPVAGLRTITYASDTCEEDLLRSEKAQILIRVRKSVASGSKSKCLFCF